MISSPNHFLANTIIPFFLLLNISPLCLFIPLTSLLCLFTPHFLHPFNTLWESTLSPYLGYCKSCPNTFVNTSTCERLFCNKCWNEVKWHLQWIVQLFSSNFLPRHPVVPDPNSCSLSLIIHQPHLTEKQLGQWSRQVNLKSSLSLLLCIPSSLYPPSHSQIYSKLPAVVSPHSLPLFHGGEADPGGDTLILSLLKTPSLFFLAHPHF